MKTEQKARVFFAEPNPRYDLTAAKVFGEIVYLAQNPMNPFNTADLVQTVQRRLEELKFDPEVDVVCLTGYQLNVSMMLAVVVRRYPSVRVVMFDSRNSTYKERRLNATVTGDSHAEVASTHR